MRSRLPRAGEAPALPGQRILVIANYAGSMLSFRGALLAEMARLGHAVTVAVPAPLGSLPGDLAALGVSCVELPMDRASADPLADLALCWRIHGLARRLRPELCLCYTIKPVIWGSIAAALAGCPRIAGLIPGLGHAFTGDDPGRRLLALLVRGLYRIALDRVATVFFLNRDDRADFLAWGLVRERQAVQVPGEGIDTARFAPSAAPPEPATFLLIARLLWDKGIGTYVDAARLVRARHPRAVFRLLGPIDANPSGIPADQLRAWIDEGVIEHLGEAGDVRPALARAAVFVLPSHYREGLPRTILEAMAMGRAVIASDAPGCRDAVDHGVTGLLVPMRDPRALAQAMERFIADPALAMRMGRAGRRLAEERFAVGGVTARIIAALKLGPASEPLVDRGDAP